MIRRDRISPPEADRPSDLTPDQITVLTEGWDALSDPADLSAWNFDDAEYLDAYRRHKAFIDAEARRRGREQPEVVEWIGLWRKCRTDLRIPDGLV